MASIRKTKKALKREIWRVKTELIDSFYKKGFNDDMRILFHYRHYLELKIKSFGKEEPNPWTDEFSKLSELEQRKLLKLINGIR